MKTIIILTLIGLAAIAYDDLVGRGIPRNIEEQNH
jgi:hypothetical protein